MTTSDKLREFADKWGFSQDKTDEGFLIDNDRTRQCLSDLTALISENYYPKEFVEWVCSAIQGCGMYFEDGIYSFGDYDMNIDELFEYWKNISE